MGRASGNGMSGVLIYTKSQDWSDWASWELLLAKASAVGLKGPRLREIQQLKDNYRDHGTKNKRRYAAIVQEVDDMAWDKIAREGTPKYRKPVKAKRRLR